MLDGSGSQGGERSQRAGQGQVKGKMLKDKQNELKSYKRSDVFFLSGILLL